MINIEKIFNTCKEVKGFDQKNVELLNNILSIKSPIDFDNRFATDEELEFLLLEMKHEDLRKPNMEKLKEMICSMKPTKSTQVGFI